MAQFHIIRSNVPGKIPTAAQLVAGALGLNTADGILFVGTGTDVLAVNDFANLKNTPTKLAGYGIDDAINAAQRAAANGVASLDANGLVPSSQLPFTQMRALSLRRTTTYPLTTTATDITFDSIEAVNSTAIVRNATNTGRIDVSESGLYFIHYAGTTVDTTDNSANTFALKKNGVAVTNAGASVTTGSTTSTFVGSTIVSLSAGDYLSISGMRGSGNGVVQVGMTVQAIKLDAVKGDAGLMGGNNTSIVFAPYFESVGTGWNVTTLATLQADPITTGMQVRAFDDTAEEAVGLLLYVPPTATKITFDLRWRAAIAPTSDVMAALRFHGLSIPESGAPTAWVASAAQMVNALHSTNFTRNQITLNISDLGLIAGSASQVQISRQGSNANDTLVGDLYLAMAGAVFS